MRPEESSTRGTPAIEVSGLGLSYGDRTREFVVFDKFDLEVHRGDFLWLAGKNGVGKTTLLKALGGIVSSQRGNVTMFGEPLCKGTIGFVFQDAGASLLPWLSARANIELPLKWAGKPRAMSQARSSAVAGRLGLDFDLDRYPYELSGGQQQLVNVARALVVDPDVLLLDEPLKELDLAHRVRLCEGLRAVWEERRLTVVLAAHELESSLDLATRVILLDRQPARIALDEGLGPPGVQGRTTRVQRSRERIQAMLRERSSP